MKYFIAICFFISGYYTGKIVEKIKIETLLQEHGINFVIGKTHSSITFQPKEWDVNYSSSSLVGK